MITLNTKLSEVTLGELLEFLEGATTRTPYKSVVHGISGLAQLFGVSESTAKRIKASGIVNAAISQSGRTIVVDAPKALELYRKATHGRSNF